MNVAALPASLFESELFGHEKGAFTGATASRTGRFELAHRGTLFLDEVGDIPGEVQPKLLRALQEREFERLGSTRTQKVDVRVVAATNRDLERMVEDGSFRSDLFYRLNVFPIRIPPLKERVEDISALAKYFAEKSARRLGRPVPSISDAQMNALKGWDWPGNIRELQNVIERAVIVSTGPSLEVPLQDLQPKARKAAPVSKPATFHDTEREAILGALRESDGVIAGPSGAAARLGLRRTTLQFKDATAGVRRPSYSPADRSESADSDRGLRVLHAIHDFLPRHQAGSEIYAAALCRELMSRHHVTIVCADYDPGRQHGQVTWREYESLPVVEITNNWICSSFADTYLPPVVSARLRQVLDIVQPHIVHVHNLLNLSFDLPAAARERGIPVVATLHDFTLVCPSGGQRIHQADSHVCHTIDAVRCARCFKESPFYSQAAAGSPAAVAAASECRTARARCGSSLAARGCSSEAPGPWRVPEDFRSRKRM